MCIIKVSLSLNKRTTISADTGIKSSILSRIIADNCAFIVLRVEKVGQLVGPPSGKHHAAHERPAIVRKKVINC